jgi:hypothetical protein
MKPALADDDLRQRLRELGDREAATAPSLDRVLRGRGPLPAKPSGEPHGAGWLRAAAALAGVFVIVALVWWWPSKRDGAGPVVGPAASTSIEPAPEWGLPTDALLADPREEAARREIERLSLEIDGLLKR